MAVTEKKDRFNCLRLCEASELPNVVKTGEVRADRVCHAEVHPLWQAVPLVFLFGKVEGVAGLTQCLTWPKPSASPFRSDRKPGMAPRGVEGGRSQQQSSGWLLSLLTLTASTRVLAFAGLASLCPGDTSRGSSSLTGEGNRVGPGRARGEAKWFTGVRSCEPAGCALAWELRDASSYSCTFGLTQTHFLERSPTFPGSLWH